MTKPVNAKVAIDLIRVGTVNTKIDPAIKQEVADGKKSKRFSFFLKRLKTSRTFPRSPRSHPNLFNCFLPLLLFTTDHNDQGSGKCEAAGTSVTCRRKFK